MSSPSGKNRSVVPGHLVVRRFDSDEPVVLTRRAEPAARVTSKRGRPPSPCHLLPVWNVGGAPATVWSNLRRASDIATWWGDDPSFVGWADLVGSEGSWLLKAAVLEVSSDDEARLVAFRWAQPFVYRWDDEGLTVLPTGLRPAMDDDAPAPCPLRVVSAAEFRDVAAGWLARIGSDGDAAVAHRDLLNGAVEGPSAVLDWPGSLEEWPVGSPYAVRVPQPGGDWTTDAHDSPDHDAASGIMLVFADEEWLTLPGDAQARGECVVGELSDERRYAIGVDPRDSGRIAVTVSRAGVAIHTETVTARDVMRLDFPERNGAVRACLEKALAATGS